MNKRIVGWEELDELVEKAVEAIKQLPVQEVYGIPRGGVLPAGLIAYKTGLKLVGRPSRRTLIVDDICDSGGTFRRHTGIIRLKERVSNFWGPKTNVFTYSVFTRQGAYYTPDVTSEVIYNKDWVVFPWEDSREETVRTGTIIL